MKQISDIYGKTINCFRSEEEQLLLRDLKGNRGQSDLFLSQTVIKIRERWMCRINIRFTRTLATNWNTWKKYAVPSIYL